MQHMSRCSFRDDDSLCCEVLMSALMQIHQIRYTLERDGKITAERVLLNAHIRVCKIELQV